MVDSPTRKVKVMAESAAAKLSRYQKRIDELQRKARQEEKVLRQRERKRRSTMLLSYGLLVMEEIKQGIRSESEVVAALDGILTQNSHRLSVGLPALNGSTNTTAKESANARKSDIAVRKKAAAVSTARSAISSTQESQYAHH